MKTLEELFVNKYVTLENENVTLKNGYNQIKEKYQTFLDGEYAIVKRNIMVYSYGTCDSETYYGGILSANKKDAIFLRECLTDKTKLRQFMGMHNGNSDYVCQLYAKEKDILLFMNKIYTIEDGNIKAEESFLSEDKAYDKYEHTVIEKIGNYLERIKPIVVENIKSE